MDLELVQEGLLEHTATSAVQMVPQGCGDGHFRKLCAKSASGGARVSILQGEGHQRRHLLRLHLSSLMITYFGRSLGSPF